MLLGGAVAGQGAIDIYLLIAIAWFSAWLGDTTSFLLGRRLGREFVLKHGPRFGISHERFEKVEDYFGRHGGKTIFIGRWISLVRAFAPFIAGSSGMGYRGFVPYSILGTGLWASLHILIGYFFSRSIETAGHYAARGAAALATLIVIVAGTVFLVRWLRVEENREKAVRWMEDHRATAWMVELARRPGLRFLWDRVTPGGTFGLEFTSLMATLAVALFVLVAYTVVIGGNPGPTPGDETAAELVGQIQAGALTAIAKVVSWFGSVAAVSIAAAICAALLAWRRRWVEFWVLVAGMAITQTGIDVLKDVVDRPAARRRRRLLLSQRPRRPLGLLPLAGDHDRLAAAAGDGAGDRGGGRRPRSHRADRALARLPPGPLPERRQRRLGAGRGGLLALRGRRAGRLASAPESRAVMPLALTDLGHQYLLYGIAAAICLVVFVTLILQPALSAYGRIWEKAAAGFLSVFVLAALVIGGVIIGLAIVWSWPDITNFINGS